MEFKVKTSIIRRFIYNVFDNKTMSTIGLSFSFKEETVKSGIKISWCRWTREISYFNRITKSYFKRTDSVLFVFDYDSKDSFTHIQE